MGERPDDPGFEAIVRLIREEEEAALEVFRRRDFRRQVEARVREVPGRDRPRLQPWRLAVPAGAAALLLFVAWAVFFRPVMPPPGAGDPPAALAAGLETLPGMTGYVSRHATRGEKAGETPAGPPSFLGALLRARDREREMSGALPPGLDVLRAPRLSLKRKMTILFKDKAIERVLMLVRKKSEEV